MLQELKLIQQPVNILQPTSREMVAELKLRLIDFYDNFIVDKRHTGIDYPVWVIWDEELPPVVGVSNIVDHYGYHDDIFFISINDSTIIGTPKIPAEVIIQLQRWILYNKYNLLSYSKGKCDISEVLRQAKAYVIERSAITA